ncbi:MAG: glycosyltransferase family 2 protein [Bacilli bacterium]|nr:glycosyltransferase family 2 protein [Bacilli bacterium]
MSDIKTAQPILYVVVPCYNEQEVLPDSSSKLLDVLEGLKKTNKISQESRIVFVNDGSKDRTWELISELAANNKSFVGVKLSRNKGHQNALLAGLEYSVERSDIMITIDADLQDDENAIVEMVDAYVNGSDIVYGVRSSRKKDSFFKRFTAQGFYKMLKWMGVDIVYNHADYRLMSKRAVRALLQFRETNLFLRGMDPQIGYPHATVSYERKERMAGESKYPLKKMLAFAYDGVTSFSVKPLSFITKFGILLSCLALVGVILSLIWMFALDYPQSWPLILSAIGFFSGVQISCLGLVGGYIGKIYAETKHRPRYFIEEILD